MFTVSISGCNEPTSFSLSPEENVSIRLAGGDWGYPSPYAHYPRGPGGFKMCLIFDSLLERDEKGLIPWLAEKYEVTDDGKACVFTLREGIKWQDGTPLTPEDVRFSIEYANLHPMTWSFVFNEIRQVRTEPGNRIRISMKKPSVSMIYNLGMTRIIPKHIWKNVKNPKAFTAPEAVIGSGPYRLTGYSKEHGTYRFEANDGFWGPKPRVRQISFIPVSEEILAYENGEIDMASVIPDLLPRFQKKPENKIVRSPGFWGYRLLFNMKDNETLRQKPVRQAFALSIDRRELVEKIARGAAIPGSPGILPPDHILAAKDLPSWPHDPDKAKQLLAGVGYRQEENGKTGLRFELLCSGREVRMAEIMRQRLAETGIDITIRSVDGKTRDAKVKEQDYQLAIIGHGGWGRDPDYLAAHFTGELATQTSSPSGSGMKGFESPELMELLRRQTSEFEPEKRLKLLKKIQTITAYEVPEIPLFYTTGYTVYRPRKYDGWIFMYDHHSLSHSKLSWLERK